jgi:hypothetical protein
MSENIRKYLSDIGKRGGRKSRRTLDSETARNMVRLREAKRAFRRFYARCFWSYDPDYVLTLDDIEWVAKQLMKNGGREAWEVGAKLCR